MLKDLLLSIVSLLTGFFYQVQTVLPIPSPTPIVIESPTSTIPQTYIIPQRLHVFQTFNNCGPASLSMLLSYFDTNVSQQELGQQLRPYQNSRGDNDDKSVTLEELAKEAERRGFNAYFRPSGNPEILKKFISQGTPVIVRTWLKTGEDIGHYRVIRGYDETGFWQDDSLQGKNLHYSYTELDKLWKAFNYEYLVISQTPLEVSSIQTAWNDTRRRLLAESDTDMYHYFNLSVAEYHLGNYQASIDNFEKVESQLPMRMLWYQIEPIQAYFSIGDYDRVMQLTDHILNNHNRAFSELYDLRGQVYQKQNNQAAAEAEFAKARQYNVNYDF